MRKILYSPRYGAGWTTWNTKPEVKKYMLEYEPIITHLEKHGLPIPEEILTKMCDEIKEKFNETHVCVLGARNLKVEEVNGPVRIEEYDGKETVVESYDDWM